MSSFEEKVKRKCKHFWLGPGSRKGGERNGSSKNSFKEKANKKNKHFWFGSGSRKGGGALPKLKMSSFKERIEGKCEHI